VRVAPTWSDLAQRPEDEASLVQARMRQFQRRRVAPAGIVIEQVEVERANGIGYGAGTPEIGFQREQPMEQRRWGHLARDDRDAIDEPGLIGDWHRLGQKPSGTPDHLNPDSGQRGERGRRGFARRPRRRRREIAANADQDHFCSLAAHSA